MSDTESHTIPTDNTVSMDFQNVNFLNVRLNLLTGNLLPMTNLPYSLFWKIYSFFVWLSGIIVFILMIPGCMNAPIEKTLIDGTVCLVESLEMYFMVLQIFRRKDLVHQIIQKLNEKLYSPDKTMRNVVTTTLQPIKIPLNFYWFAGVTSITAWHCIPFVMKMKKNLFYYEDYRIPAAFAEQPFSFRIFLLGSLYILISMLFIWVKKVGVEVYTMHLILMITAQYRYLALKVANVFQEENEGNNSQRKHSHDELDRKKETELRVLCRHHNDVIFLTSLIKELLSLNLSLMYVINILRFCGVAFMLSTIASSSMWEAISVLLYMASAIVQLYILCSCVQQLLDASTEITDKAFHENWYLLQPSIKHIFILMIMANNLECRIATFKNFNFSLPSFMKILNQSYSIALLFLRTN